MYKNILILKRIKDNKLDSNYNIIHIQKILLYNDIGIELDKKLSIYSKENSYQIIFYTKVLISKLKFYTNKLFILYNIEINLKIYKYLGFLVKNISYPAISLADSFWACNDFLEFNV